MYTVTGQLMKSCAHELTGLEIEYFSREPNCILKSYLKVLCIESSTSVGSLHKYGGAAVEFKGVLDTP